MVNNSKTQWKLCAPKMNKLSDEEVDELIQQQKNKKTITENFPNRTIQHYDDITGHFDNRIWDQWGTHFRNGDIIVTSWAKSGSTWMCQILLQLINQGKETLSDKPVGNIHNKVFWLDAIIMAPTEHIFQTLDSYPMEKRRLYRTHCPLPALNFSPKAKYVYVTRDGRDSALSIYNHHQSFTDEFRSKMKHLDEFNNFNEWWDKWINHQCHPYWDYYDHTRQWAKAASCENVMIINYSEMKNDLSAVLRRLAAFVGIPLDVNSQVYKDILYHCSWEYMKEHEVFFEPPPFVMKHGAFVNKGVSGGWKNVLTEEQNKQYWEKIRKEWSTELIEFIHGKLE